MSIAIADERPSRRSVARAGRRLARQSKPPKRCRCATNSEAACLRSRKPPVMMRLPRHQTSHPDRRALLIQIVAVQATERWRSEGLAAAAHARCYGAARVAREVGGLPRAPALRESVVTRRLCAHRRKGFPARSHLAGGLRLRTDLQPKS